jgi:mRNA interferase RelE/StbE
VTAPRWEVVVAASAERQLARLPAKIAAAVVEFLLEALAANRHVVGHRLRRELERLWSARRGNYRVVYEIDETEHRVVVLRVEHRADVYRPR